MIEPSKSPWACGVVMAKKKGGQLRFCCDFRYVNAVTIKDAYPIPRIDESLSKLGDAKFFTTLDLGSAFWQVPLRKQDREKTGFVCVRAGIVPVEEDAVWVVQRDGHIPATNGPGTHECDEEIRESHHVLRR